MRTLKNICLWLAAVGMMASCLSSSDDNSSTLYNDAAITSFSLGTLKRTVTTADTTYTTTVTGSSYKFNISQVAEWDESLGRAVRHIYNTDSLPTGTDVTRVVCTVASRNSGIVVVQDADSDTLRYYSSTDSLDFTKPRSFLVYSTDGTNSQEYLVKLNVHQEEANGFDWQLMATDWTPATPTTVLPDTIRQLLGGCTTEQYALSADSLLKVSRDGGLTWVTDLLDDTAELLPTDDVTLVSYPMALSDSTDYVLMAGRREVTATDGTKSWQSRVWRKIVDIRKQAVAGRWAYMEPTADNPLTLPALETLQLVKYDDGVLAIGKPYTQIYQSRDNGITWKNNPIYQLPADFDATATAVTMTVDGDNFVWLYCEGTGQVWRGRLNRLGWEQ